MNNEIILTIFVQSIAFIAAFVKMFTDMKLKLKELEIRLYGVEKKDNEMSQKLEKIFASLNEIKLALKDKFTWNNADFVSVATNKRTVTLSYTTTAGYTAGEFKYELQVDTGSGIYTWMIGYIEVQDQITS